MSTVFCSNCHNSGTAFGTVTVDIQIFQQGTSTPITAYVGGTLYDMRVTVSNSSGTPLAYGFQMTALTSPANAALAGYTNLASNVKLKLITTGTFNGRTYVEHNGVVNNNQFNFSWTAPAAGTGTVKFYASGNAVNDNNSSSGDKSGNTSLTLLEQTPLVVNTSSANPTCFGFANGSINLDVSGSAMPYTFLWNDDNVQEDRTDLSEGSYEVTVSGADAQQIILSFDLDAPSLLEISAVANDPLFPNEEGSVDITPQGGTSPFVITINNEVIGTIVPTEFLMEGCYEVMVTDANDCEAISNYCINVPDELTAEADMQQISCNGAEDGSIALDVHGATAPYFVSWSNGDEGVFIDSLSAGNYTATITDDVGYVQQFDFEITAPIELMMEVEAEEILCNGESAEVMVTASGGTLPYTGTGNFIRSAGNYLFEVMDQNGCVTSSEISIDEPLELELMTNSDTIPCIGGIGLIQVMATGGTEPYTGTGDFEVTTPGMMPYIVIDANGCTANITATVVASDGPSFQATITEASCFGICDGSIALAVLNEEVNFTLLWNDGSTDTTHIGLCAGIYSVVLTDDNDCSINNTYVVGQPAEIAIAFEVSTILCYADTLLLSSNIFNATAPYTLSWTGGEITSSIDAVAGEYELTITDANQCIQSETIFIAQPDSLFLQGLVTQVLCFGDDTGMIDLTVAGGTAPFQFDWTNGTVDEDIVSAIANNYSVLVEDNNGCQASLNFEITQPDPLEIIVDDFVSGGLGVGNVAVTILGGNPPYTYLWTDGQSEEDVTLPTESTQTLTVTDANGCTNTSQVFEVDNSIHDIGLVEVSLFPVPFNDMLLIESNYAIAQVSIVNTQGQVVFESNENKRKLEVETSLWSAGIYSVLITTDREVVNKKVVKW